MTHSTRLIRQSPIQHTSIPLVAESHPGSDRDPWPGLRLECPLCPVPASGLRDSHLHPVDSRSAIRPSLFGSDGRHVTSILVGCEEDAHVLVLEVANWMGRLNLGFRTPYAGEVISEWRNGTFDNPAPFGGVRFNPDFVITEGDRA